MVSAMGTSLPGLLVNTSATWDFKCDWHFHDGHKGGQDLEGLGQEPLNLPRPRDLDLVLQVTSEDR